MDPLYSQRLENCSKWKVRFDKVHTSNNHMITEIVNFWQPTNKDTLDITQKYTTRFLIYFDTNWI